PGTRRAAPSRSRRASRRARRTCAPSRSSPGGCPGRWTWSCRKDRDACGAGCAVELGVADGRVAGHLPVAGLTAQLQHDLVHLAQPGRTDRLAVRGEPAVGVDRQTAVDLELTARDQRLLLAVRAEAVLGQMDHLRAGV